MACWSGAVVLASVARFWPSHADGFIPRLLGAPWRSWRACDHAPWVAGAVRDPEAADWAACWATAYSLPTACMIWLYGEDWISFSYCLARVVPALGLFLRRVPAVFWMRSHCWDVAFVGVSAFLGVVGVLRPSFLMIVPATPFSWFDKDPPRSDGSGRLESARRFVARCVPGSPVIVMPVYVEPLWCLGPPPLNGEAPRSAYLGPSVSDVSTAVLRAWGTPWMAVPMSVA